MHNGSGREHTGRVLVPQHARRHREFAERVTAEYGPCKAVCESTGSHWTKTADVFEDAGIPLELANPLKTYILKSRSNLGIVLHTAACFYA